MDELLCGSCKETKPTHSFNRNGARHNGFDNYCRQCMKQRGQKRDRSRRKHLDVVPADRQCSISDCSDRLKGHGYCNRHLKRYRQYGDPLAGGKFHEPSSQKPRRDHGMTLEEAFRYFMPGEPPPEGEPWLWTGPLDENGYGTIRHNGKSYGAHRVSYELFVGRIPDGLHIRHKSDTPPDVNPHNLEVGTRADNVRDRVERGRSFKGPFSEERLAIAKAAGARRRGTAQARAAAARGSQQGLSKLNDSDVLQIRELRRSGWTQAALAGRFGVAQSNISMIINRKTWTHI